MQSSGTQETTVTDCFSIRVPWRAGQTQVPLRRAEGHHIDPTHEDWKPSGSKTAPLSGIRSYWHWALPLPKGGIFAKEQVHLRIRDPSPRRLIQTTGYHQVYWSQRTAEINYWRKQYIALTVLLFFSLSVLFLPIIFLFSQFFKILFNFYL